jgi:hypothetical protein
MRMQNTNDESVYRVSDFPLVVSLAVSFPILSVERDDPRRVHFLFEQSDALAKLVEAYNRRELRIEPQLFYHTMKSVKSRLYDYV